MPEVAPVDEQIVSNADGPYPLVPPAPQVDAEDDAPAAGLAFTKEKTRPRKKKKKKRKPSGGVSQSPRQNQVVTKGFSNLKSVPNARDAQEEPVSFASEEQSMAFEPVVKGGGKKKRKK